MAIYSISTTNTTKTTPKFKHFWENSLLFAESTTYNNQAGTQEKTYSSNIRILFTDGNGKKGSMPLYQVYYNNGQKNWGLWRCPYIHGAWEKPKFYSTAKMALSQARLLYLEEEFEEGEYEVAKTSHITYSEKTGKGKLDYKILQQETYFSKYPA